MSECGQDVNVELQDVITNPFPQLPAIPPSTGVGEVIDIGDWPSTGLIGITPGIQVPTLSNYRPQVGDLAYLIKQGSQWIALGSLSTRGIGGALPTDGSNGDGSVWRWSFEGQSATGLGWTKMDNAFSGGYVGTAAFAQTTPIQPGSKGLYPAPHGSFVQNTNFSQGTACGYNNTLYLSPVIPTTPGAAWEISGSTAIDYTIANTFQQACFIHMGVTFNGGVTSTYDSVGTVGAATSSDWRQFQQQIIASGSSMQIIMAYELRTQAPDCADPGFLFVTGSWLFDNILVRRI